MLMMSGYDSDYTSDQAPIIEKHWSKGKNERLRRVITEARSDHTAHHWTVTMSTSTTHNLLHGIDQKTITTLTLDIPSS